MRITALPDSPPAVRKWPRRLKRISALVLVFVFSGCTQLDQPQPESFFSQSAPPAKQEFRWSNGQLPKHLDPAFAAAAPETDIVRAVYEGLTEIDPETLAAIPAAAESWESSPDMRTWTFQIREAAKWANGDPLLAGDFVRSWERLIALGDQVAHPQLLDDLTKKKSKPAAGDATPESDDFIVDSFRETQETNDAAANVNTNSATVLQTPAVESATGGSIYAKGPRTFVVVLKTPDRDLPKLAANPMFRPVHRTNQRLLKQIELGTHITNGSFTVSRVEAERVVVDRSESYWNASSVALSSVHFVAKAKPEDALQAYRAGELDAVTNAVFEPLALKLLEPYDDFRKSTFAAVNFYKVNSAAAPFSDRRVRQALSMAIERERLTDGDLAGTTRPALSLFPFPTDSQTKITEDKAQARELLDEAGFPEGSGFPVLRLVVNRNDAQQRIARSVARMWKQNLNLETEIIVKESEEVRSAIDSGEYDLVRRGVVLPTADERAGLRAIFEQEPQATVRKPNLSSANSNSNTNSSVDNDGVIGFTEEIALYELEAIPLYFPTSYSLVRPYVLGFQSNVLDAPLLQNVRIDNNWQPKKAKQES